jgi:phage terminase small subunit
MPQPRKPSSVHERTGAYAHDPKRKRKDPRGVGKLSADPPEHLDFDRFQTRAWRELVEVIPAGVGTGSDKFVVEMAARLIGSIRKTGRATAAEFGQLRVYIGSLGLSPADRARLGAPQEDEPEDGFEEFRGAGARAVGNTLKFPAARK